MTKHQMGWGRTFGGTVCSTKQLIQCVFSFVIPQQCLYLLFLNYLQLFFILLWTDKAGRINSPRALCLLLHLIWMKTDYTGIGIFNRHTVLCAAGTVGTWSICMCCWGDIFCYSPSKPLQMMKWFDRCNAEQRWWLWFTRSHFLWLIP